MFPRLRLDGLVGGNHQQHQVDAAHPCEHIANKALVPRNVDKTQAQDFAVRG